MARYVLEMTEQKQGGFGRFKDETRDVVAPFIRDTKKGGGIIFRHNDLKTAEAALKALNDGAVHLGGEGSLDTFLSGKYAGQTLKSLGYL